MISPTSRMLAVAIAGLFLLSGCGGDEPGEPADDETSSVSIGAASPALSAPAPARAPQQAPQQEKQASSRKEVTTGNVRVVAPDPVRAARSVAGAVTALGGRIDSRTEQPEPPQPERPRPLPARSQTPTPGPRASLTVRVPADKTDRLLTELGTAGRIASVTISKDDVTLKSDDMDARIRALQTSVERLRALIANAANVADLISAENALSSRQGELDGLLAQKRTLDDQVALSTINISFSTDERQSVAEREDDSFWDGLKSGWNSLRDAVGDTVVFIGSALPWLGFFAVIGAVLWWVGRRLWRRKRDRNVPAAPTAERAAGTVASPAPGGENPESSPGKGVNEPEAPASTKPADRPAASAGQGDAPGDKPETAGDEPG